jgi:molybdenum cofactor cytidylyltransferase
VNELKVANYDAILFTTIDQPFVDQEHLRRLVASFETASHKVVASRYGSPETLGIPAIFAKDLFDRLLQLRGDKGAKQIIASLTPYCVDAPMANFDIDTPRDLEECSAHAQKLHPPNLSDSISSNGDRVARVN